GCHGTYDVDPDKETFPNLLIPLEVIGTDPLLGDSSTEEVSALVDWYNESFYGTITQLVVEQPFVGYTAPPLDGIWATAPFFHNGSVPTLELVLDSSKRPSYWRRENYDSQNYDWNAIGWVWQELDYGLLGLDRPRGAAAGVPRLAALVDGRAVDPDPGDRRGLAGHDRGRRPAVVADRTDLRIREHDPARARGPAL